jgi:hypothetical protein
MISMEKGDYPVATNVGILADLAGTGKSLTILALIAHRGPINSHWTPETNGIDIKPSYADTSVVIAPKNVVPQWVGYITNQTSLSHHVGSTVDPAVDVNLLSDEEAVDFFTSPVHVRRIVIDELDSLRISVLARKIRARCQFIWLVTATPGRLLTRELDLYSYFTSDGEYTGGLNSKRLQLFFNSLAFPRCLLANISSTCFDGIVIRNDPLFVEQSIRLPKPVHRTVVCERPNLLRILPDHDLTRLSACLEAHDYQGLSRHLRCELKRPVDVVTALIEKYRQRISQLSRQVEAVREMGPTTFETLFPGLSRNDRIKFLNREIDSAESRLDSISGRLRALSKEMCGICLEGLQPDRAVMLMSCCQNLLCPECSVDYRTSRDRCPYCREELEMILLSEEATFNREELVRIDKIDWLVRTVREKPEGKFLVFSNYDDTFRQIAARLEKRSIDCLIVDDRHAVENRDLFEKTNVLLLNSMRYGAGLNLQLTTDLVVFHELDQYLNEQVIGRAQRIGRKESLNVYYLKYEHPHS